MPISSPFEARIKTSYSFAVVAVFTFLTGIILYAQRKYNDGGLLFLTILFALPCTYFWIELFDRQSKIVIAEEGITIRKSFFPFAPFCFIPWSTIYFFYVLEKRGNGGPSHILFVSQKGNEKIIRLNMDQLDQPWENIVWFLKEYALKYNFHDLGLDRQGNKLEW